MSDVLDEVRAANPVRQPVELTPTVQQRILAATYSTNRGPMGVRGRIAQALARKARLRVLIAGAAMVCAAGGTALGLGLSAQRSAPPTGPLTSPSWAAYAANRYAVSVTPDPRAGQVGWCVATSVYNRHGGASGTFGCGYAPVVGHPIVINAEGAGGTRLGDVYTSTTTDVLVTTSQVAAVRIGSRLTIRTIRDPQLPDDYRVAIHIQQTVGHKPLRSPPLEPTAVALNDKGQVIANAAQANQTPHDTSQFWPAGHVRTAPAARCEIYAGSLHGAFGGVVEHIHGITDLAERTFLSCAETNLTDLQDRGALAAILLDAQHPGTTAPPPLPNSKPVPGHPGFFNEPAIEPPPIAQANPHFGLTSLTSAITGRRIGNTWLIVQSPGTIQQRLAVLRQLTTCIHQSGALCAVP